MEKNEQPIARQMVQFYKSPTIDSKHTHPDEWGKDRAQKGLGETRIVTQNRFIYEQFSSSEHWKMFKKLLFKIVLKTYLKIGL